MPDQPPGIHVTCPFTVTYLLLTVEASSNELLMTIKLILIKAFPTTFPLGL